MPVSPAFSKMTSGNGWRCRAGDREGGARDCHARAVGHATDLASRMEGPGWECPPVDVRLATADAITAEQQLDSRQALGSLAFDGDASALNARRARNWIATRRLSDEGVDTAIPNSPGTAVVLLARAVVAGVGSEARGRSGRCALGMESISGFRPLPWEDRR